MVPFHHSITVATIGPHVLPNSLEVATSRSTAHPGSVLLVVRPAQGGIRQHVLTLARALSGRGVRVGIAAGDAFLRTLPADLPVTSSPVPLSDRMTPTDLLCAFRTQRIAASYDIVHAHGLRAGWVAALARTRAPLVVTTHNQVTAGLVTRVALPIVAGHTRTWIAVSDAVRDGLVGVGVAKDAVTVIPNAVDSIRFQALPDGLHARSGLSLEGPAVGCIARLSPEKGVETLIEAARVLPEFTFVIAGDGPQRSSLAASATPNVRFLGHVSDVRPILAAVDMVVIPSLSEGQGIVALEAMAACVPLIASRVGGLGQMLTDGVTARLVEPGDATTLAATIRDTARDPGRPQQMAQNAFELVKRVYSVDGMTEAVLGVYRTAVKD